MNKWLNVAARVVLATSMVVPTIQMTHAVAMETPIKDTISTLSNQQLQALTNPILQSYQADASHKVWTLSQDTRLVVNATQANIDNHRLQEVVALVNSELVEKKIVSAPLAMVFGQEKDMGAGDIFIDLSSKITDQSTSDEAYKIVINDKGVVLTAASENAVMYGLRTIQNLMTTAEGLVYGEIVDYPVVAERRLHVDCARKYISKDWFIRQIREMSYMKMNAIQMHFSENLGFRIECETDPAIVSDEYLTKAEVREILAEAKKYGIKVIPSFDSPGHVDQILKVHPEYGQISNTGAHYKSGLDVTNPKAVAYIRSLYDEYMDLFEGCTDFHIGGDEYMEFDRNPFYSDYRSVLDEYAKKTYGQDYTWKDTISGYINDLAAYVHERGFTPRIWNDGIYYGEYSQPQKIKMHDYIGIDFWSQMGWNPSIAKLQTFIDKGHDTIYNINASFFYYVLRNDKPTDGREQHSFDNLNADRKIYDEWTPGKFQANTLDDQAPQIKGASMAIWCDKPDLVSEDVITEDIADELRALASKSWNTNSPSIASFDKFKENYTTLGHAAGYEKGSVLPDAGEFMKAEDLGKITIQYVDVSNPDRVIKEKTYKYGTIGEAFEVKAPDIYGYRLVSKDTISDVFTKEEMVYTFEYEPYTNKEDLNQELERALDVNDYISETVATYDDALAHGKAISEKVDASQEEVDVAYTALREARLNAVHINYYPLYVEAMYPLSQNHYVGGYDTYKQAVDAGRALLNSEEITLDAAKSSYDAIIAAKAGLVKPDGNAPTIHATDPYYSDWSVNPRDKYSYEKMIDNDLETKCWFQREQAAGGEIKFKFPETVVMSSVKVTQPADVGADAIKAADIEVSSDGVEWKKVGHFDETNLEYTATFDKTPVQFVRIVLTESKPRFWYQVAEVSFSYEQKQEDNSLRDMITEAEELTIHGKSQVLVGNMINALIEAQKAYVGNVLDTSEIQAHLREAIDALVNSPDITGLKDAIEEAKKLDKDRYTEESWNVFEDALNRAETLLQSPTLSTEDVGKALADLSQAQGQLKEKPTTPTPEPEPKPEPKPDPTPDPDPSPNPDPTPNPDPKPEDQNRPVDPPKHDQTPSTGDPTKIASVGLASVVAGACMIHLLKKKEEE